MTATASSEEGLAAKAAELLASGPDRSPPSYGVPKGEDDDPAADIASMLTMYAQAAKLMVGLPRYRYLQAYQLDACLLEPLLEGCVEWALTPQQSGGSSSGSEHIVLMPIPLAQATWAAVD